MSDLYIYKCPECGWWEGDANREPGGLCNGAEASDWPTHKPADMVQVHVFREEAVRPLWEAARAFERHALAEIPAITGITELRTFPVPAEWTR